MRASDVLTPFLWIENSRRTKGSVLEKKDFSKEIRYYSDIIGYRNGRHEQNDNQGYFFAPYYISNINYIKIPIRITLQSMDTYLKIVRSDGMLLQQE